MWMMIGVLTCSRIKMGGWAGEAMLGAEEGTRAAMMRRTTEGRRPGTRENKRRRRVCVDVDAAWLDLDEHTATHAVVPSTLARQRNLFYEYNGLDLF